MKTVARYASRHEADLAAGFLRDAGIVTTVHSDDAAGWEPGLTFVRSVWVAVPEADVARAQEVLEGLSPVRAAADPADPEATEARKTPGVGWLIVGLLMVAPLVVVGQLIVWAASGLGAAEPPAVTPDMRAILVAAVLAAVIVVVWYHRFRRGHA